MLNPNGEAIYSASLTEFADLVYDIVVTKAPKGKNVSKLWEEVYKALLIIDALEDVDYYTETHANPLYSCASQILEISDSSSYPTPSSPVTITLNQGSQGIQGIQGEPGETTGGVDFSTGSITVTTVADSFGVGEAYAARWDYIVNGTPQRAGTIVATWLEDGSAVDWHDVSTPDIGGVTSPVSFTVTYAASTISLNAVIASGTWVISGTRYWIPNGGNYIDVTGTDLTNGYIWIGNGSNLPVERLLSGAIAVTNTGVTSINPNTIVNVDINSSANIAVSKLASLTVDRVVVTNAVTGKIETATPTITEINRIAGITGSIMTLLNAKQDTITGAATTVVSSNLSASVAVVTTAGGKLADGGATAIEIGRLSGLSGNIMTLLNAKQDTITGAASTVTSANLTANRILVSGAGGKIEVSSVSSTTLLYGQTAINIGDWDMDTTAFVSVTHGIASGLTKIKSVFVAIYIDGGGSPIYDLSYQGNGGVWWDGALIHLNRLAAGIFDNTNYNATGFNRGTIFITYEL